MYTQSYDPNLLYQGDVLKNIPFVLLPNSDLSVSTLDRQFELDNLTKDFFGVKPKVVPSEFYSTTGMIISQNCDIDNRNFILCAPIFPISLRYPQNNQHVIQLKKQRVNYEMYLESNPEFNESFVDLQLISAVKQTIIKKENRIAVLSVYGKSVLQQHLRDFLGRIETKDYI